MATGGIRWLPQERAAHSYCTRGLCTMVLGQPQDPGDHRRISPPPQLTAKPYQPAPSHDLGDQGCSGGKGMGAAETGAFPSAKGETETETQEMSRETQNEAGRGSFSLGHLVMVSHRAAPFFPYTPILSGGICFRGQQDWLESDYLEAPFLS